MVTGTPPASSALPRAPVADAPRLRLRLRDGTPVTLHTSDLWCDATIAGDERAEITAQIAGGVAGKISYARVYGPRAVLCIEVAETYWHRGLPALLLSALCARAAQLGIATFLMHIRADDLRLLALLCERFDARTNRDGAYVDVEFAVPVP